MLKGVQCTSVYLYFSFIQHIQQKELSGEFLGPFLKFLKATISYVISVRLSARNNPAPTARIFFKLDMS